MPGFDTDLAQGRGRFPDTTWGLLARLSDPRAPDYRVGLEELARRYWKPVYHYLRIAWAKNNEDAKDLTQAFFLWLLEGEALGRYAPQRGSFRTFLKTILQGFVVDRERALNALKRGGGAKTLSLDDPDLPLDDAALGSDPDKAFDKMWARTLTEHAIATVRERYASGGREKQFQVFEQYDLCPPSERPTYKDLGARLGIKETDVRNYLVAVRREVHAQIQSELVRLTTNDAEAQEEWNALFGA